MLAVSLLAGIPWRPPSRARGLAAATKAEPEPDFESFVRGWKSCEEFKANGFALETIQEIIFSSK